LFAFRHNQDIHPMTNPIVAPYGSWKSPITAEMLTSHAIVLEQVAIDGETIYWTEGHPEEDGRSVLMRIEPGHSPVECLPPQFSVRSRVYEYGGGAFAVSQGSLFFVNFDDQQLYRQAPGGLPERLSNTDGYRYGDLVCDTSRRWLVCIREDHTIPGLVTDAIVVVPFDGGDGQVLIDGWDFFSTARLSPDGTCLAWLCWNHPRMPWDGCELWLAGLSPQGGLLQPHRVAGSESESIFQPDWSPQGVLHFVSDRAGWWNLYRLQEQVESLCPLEGEFGLAQWNLAMSTYAFLSESEILCTFTQAGFWKLARLDTVTKQLSLLDLSYTDISDLHSGPGFAVFLAGSPHQPTTLVKWHLLTQRTETLRYSLQPALDLAWFSPPQPLEFPTENGLTSHGIYYPPVNPHYRPSSGGLPPLLVMCHGGPTGLTATSLRLGIQFWTSRGFAILDVNYGGSTGYGRFYRERLNGNWGVVDVDDCCNGARWLVAHGLFDPHRLAISGGSAGGFTTLSALLFRDSFQAGTSYYGISDPEALARKMHKFESCYMQRLIGPYPQRRDIYLLRSPIHAAEKLTTPLLLMQGDSDPIVPPAQTERLYQVVRSQGVPVACLLFAGEGHGFRLAKTLQRAILAELAFYTSIFHLPLPDPLPPLQIENMD
jgi:dipeptidyl aminopeptidase/acylaminoacyl peptidase